jgi:hypothetical protein
MSPCKGAVCKPSFPLIGLGFMLLLHCVLQEVRYCSSVTQRKHHNFDTTYEAKVGQRIVPAMQISKSRNDTGQLFCDPFLAGITKQPLDCYHVTAVIVFCWLVSRPDRTRRACATLNCQSAVCGSCRKTRRVGGVDAQRALISTMGYLGRD